MIEWSKRNILYIAWIFATLALFGSLYFSEILRQTPCILCWYQRIVMYPLVIIIGVGIIRKTKDLAYFVLPLSIIGLLISLYHNLLQYGIIPEAVSPCTLNAPCITSYALFGFVTIPLLAFITFTGITVCLIIYNRIKHI